MAGRESEQGGDWYLLIDSKWAILGGEILGVHVSMHPSLHSEHRESYFQRIKCN